MQSPPDARKITLCVPALIALVVLFFPASGLSQGCPPARSFCPYLGVQDRSYLEPHEWLLTVSYRHYHAFRDYQGSTALPVPSPPEIYAQTRVNLFDLTLTHAFTRRFSLSAEFPFEKASRETYLEHDGVTLHTMHASGLGDIRIISNYWILDPDTHSRNNFSVKLGLQTPTGKENAQDYSYRETGAVLRPVDPAIQPGTGSWGIVFGAQGFKTVFKETLIYADGIYLSNPREMNGIESPFGDRPEFTGGDIGYIVDSVPDQYFLRVGVSQPVLPSIGLSATFGSRVDGLRARDWIGGSDGYRIPGYSVSIEPGFALARGRDFFSLTLPFTVKGHTSKTLADIRTNSPIGGIGTLADSQLTLSYSRRF